MNPTSKPKRRTTSWRIFRAGLIAVAAVLVLAGGCKTPSARQSDWGTFIDPDGDCQFTVHDDSLALTIPGGIHDLSPVNERWNSPRSLKSMTGDFSMAVAVTSDFNPGTQAAEGSRSFPFNGAGLLVWAGPENYLRFERDIWITEDGSRQGYGPLVEYWHARQLAQTGRGTVDHYEGRTTYLRLNRKGATLSMQLSHDGISWIEVGSMVCQFPDSVQVGVNAINTSARPFQVTFSNLEISP